MKISKKLTEAVSGSSVNPSGTTFYRVSLEQLTDAFVSDNNSNLWMIYSIREFGFDAIKIKDIWGSEVVDDVLYLCKTDGQPLIINDVEVDPESALEDVPLQDLEEYIKDSTPEIIRKMITDYEFNFQDIDDLALKMLEDGHSFLEIAKDAQEVDLLDK